MESIFGIITAIGIILVEKFMKYDQKSRFYPVILVIIALIYILFAIIDQSSKTIIIESMVSALFILVAVIGFNYSCYITAIGLVAHGVFDLGHHHIVHNEGVPYWWPIYCLVIDVILGVWVFYQQKKRIMNNDVERLV